MSDWSLVAFVLGCLTLSIVAGFATRQLMRSLFVGICLAVVITGDIELLWPKIFNLEATWNTINTLSHSHNFWGVAAAATVSSTSLLLALRCIQEIEDYHNARRSPKFMQMHPQRRRTMSLARRITIPFVVLGGVIFASIPSGIAMALVYLLKSRIN